MRARPHGGVSRWLALSAFMAACAALIALTGCTARVAGRGAPSLTVSGAYVPLPAAAAPRVTVAFLDIRNDGGADRLVAAGTSVGGRVTFRAPAGHGMRMPAMTMTTVPAIAIPAGSTVRLLPDDAHLLITGAGPMQPGQDITLTLTFARAGIISVTAQVTDPASGGGYFTN
jgi:copper(I)-binding protein